MQDSKEVREMAKIFREAADVLDEWQTSQKTARK